MYAYYEDFCWHYVEEIVFYHLSLLSITTWKDCVLFCWLFCWFLYRFLEKLDFSSIIALNPYISLFAMWFSPQFLHFRIEWGHFCPCILHILQLCCSVLYCSAQIWQTAWAKQALVEWPYFWQFWQCLLKIVFLHFSAIS